MLEIKASRSEALNVKLSMGCTICNSKGCDFDRIYKNSDDALYEAKQHGKNGYVIREI